MHTVKVRGIGTRTAEEIRAYLIETDIVDL